MASLNSLSQHPSKRTSKYREPEPVQAIVEGLWVASFARPWKGKQGLTDWSAYKALLRCAYHHGTLIEAGVRLSLSVRQWAELAAVNKSTIVGGGKNSVGVEKRLTLDHGLIRRDGRGEGEKSRAFVLLISPLGVRSTRTFIQRYHRSSGVSKPPGKCAGSPRQISSSKDYLPGGCTGSARVALEGAQVSLRGVRRVSRASAR